MSQGDPQALRIILGLLTEHCKNVTDGQGKEVYGLLFGFVAFTWKDELIDPLDRPASLSKTVNRIMESLSSLFRESSKLVYKACAMAMSELIDNCYSDKNDPAIMD